MFEPIARAAGYLVDLDGTILTGDQLTPGAEELLANLGSNFVIVSNNAEHVPEQLARRLRRLGIRIPMDRFVLAGVAALDHAADRFPGGDVLLLASPALQRLAKRKGLRLVNEMPNAVIVGRDRRFSYKRLTLATRAIEDGASLIVACPDTSHPGIDGHRVPEGGALSSAILSVVGAVEYTIVGKPKPLLFKLACRKLGLPASRCVVIGDNPMTDGVGAKSLGIPFIEVKNGSLFEVIGAILERTAPG